jgi:hypothetical protein
METSTNNHARNAGQLRPKRHGLPICLSVLSMMFVLACVVIVPPSAQEEELPPTLPPSPVPASPTPEPSPIPTATQESECTRLKLTSQECASLGQHLFTLSGVVDGYCWYGEEDKTVTRDLLITVSFSGDSTGMSASIRNAAFIDCPMLTRSGPNTYTYDCVDHGNHETGMITFVDNGILNVGGFTNSVNKNCNWSEAYELR